MNKLAFPSTVKEHLRRQAISLAAAVVVFASFAVAILVIRLLLS